MIIAPTCVFAVFTTFCFHRGLWASQRGTARAFYTLTAIFSALTLAGVCLARGFQ